MSHKKATYTLLAPLHLAADILEGVNISRRLMVLDFNEYGWAFLGVSSNGVKVAVDINSVTTHITSN